MDHLTEFCQAQLTDFVLTGMDKQMHTGMIVVDLQKAFDTLDHEVPLEKLNYFGFRTTATKRLSPISQTEKALFLDASFFYCMDIIFPNGYQTLAPIYIHVCIFFLIFCQHEGFKKV